jgi:hypothetical protein
MSDIVEDIEKGIQKYTIWKRNLLEHTPGLGKITGSELNELLEHEKDPIYDSYKKKIVLAHLKKRVDNVIVKEEPDAIEEKHDIVVKVAGQQSDVRIDTIVVDSSSSDEDPTYVRDPKENVDDHVDDHVDEDEVKEEDDVDESSEDIKEVILACDVHYVPMIEKQIITLASLFLITAIIILI